MKIFIFVILLILLILFLPIRIKSKITYDIFKNFGFFSVYFYFIKIFVSRIKFVPFSMVMKSKKKEIKVSLKNLIGQEKFIDVFFTNFLAVLKIKSLKFYSNFEKEDNSLLPYATSGFFYIFFGIVFSALSWQKNFYNIENIHFAGFAQDDFVLNFSLSVQVNLFLILFVFFKSTFKQLKK